MCSSGCIQAIPYCPKTVEITGHMQLTHRSCDEAFDSLQIKFLNYVSYFSCLDFVNCCCHIICQTDNNSALAKLAAWHSTTGKLFSEGHKWLTHQSLNKYLTVNICILANEYFNVHLYLTKFISWVPAVSMSLLISTMARHIAIMRYSLNQ